MKLTLKVAIKTPSVPNFIIAEDGKTFSIADFTAEELQQIGEHWTAELIEKAAKRK